MFEEIASRFREVAPRADFWSLRVVQEEDEDLRVRQGVVYPMRSRADAGAMVTVAVDGGLGYSATPDLTREGLRRAGADALAWARRTAGATLVDWAAVSRAPAQGEYASLVRQPWEATSLAGRIDLLRAESERLHGDARIVDWSAAFSYSRVESHLETSAGARVRQRFHYLLPTLAATAYERGESQTRTFGGHAWARQGGLEVLDEVGFVGAGTRVGEEALELIAAPDCPSGTMDLVLAPDQMILQIHESIGHPLELDRILGDERNYAGRSFVTPEMFGTYRYGSELLNVAVDPAVPGEHASFGFDDDGEPSRREEVIRRGILLRPLGGRTSAARAGWTPLATARASSWNRPPIDRMANLNLEPGDSAFDDLVGGIDAGVYMETNCSWSIDDARNKFQFGCELGRRIEHGRIGGVVKNSNYRGISATFWRSLAGVGSRDTLRVLGTPYCGKGEPNQVIRVGHAAPACRFAAVDVFGGA
jgi:predicted Zn-dependent protease